MKGVDAGEAVSDAMPHDGAPTLAGGKVSTVLVVINDGDAPRAFAEEARLECAIIFSDGGDFVGGFVETACEAASVIKDCRCF